MDLTYLGTGEAFDTRRSNTSYLINTGEEKIMVDCGFNAPYSLRKLQESRGEGTLSGPDVLLFTHYHGDHFGGLSALLVPMWDGVRASGQGRKLIIASAHKDIEKMVKSKMQFDYPGLFANFEEDGFKVKFKTLKEDDELSGMRVRAAPTRHSVLNFAYRFDAEGTKSFAISGDGTFSDQSRDLFKGVEFLVHEGFFVDTPNPYHASMEDITNYADSNGVLEVRIIHVNQAERTKSSQIEDLLGRHSRNLGISLPSDHGQEIL